MRPGRARRACTAVAAVAAVVGTENTGADLGLGLMETTAVLPPIAILGHGPPPQAGTSALGLYLGILKIL